MNTTQPEALQLAECCEHGYPLSDEAIRAATELRRLHAYCQELESQVILDCMTHVQNPAEIEHAAGDVSKNGAGLNMSTQHARITELESQLAQRFDAADMATAAAQGFRDGVASVSAGSEPVAWREHVEQRLLAWRQSFVNRSGDQLALDDFMDEQSLDDLIDFVCDEWALKTRPSPQEGMAGWKPIETAPRDGAEIMLYAPACVYEGTPVEARITYGKWLAPSDTPRIKYQDGFAPDIEWDEFDAHWVSWDGGFTPEHSPTHWMPLPAAPDPADGESNG